MLRSLAANPLRAVYEEIGRRVTVPLLSVVEVSARAPTEQGLQRLLLMAIRSTAESRFDQAVCEPCSIQVDVPHCCAQAEMDAIIFEGLTLDVSARWSDEKLLDIAADHDAMASCSAA